MQRVLILVAVLFVIWKILAAFGKRGNRMGADDFSRFSAKQRDRRQRVNEDLREAQQDLVECAVCSTYIPSGRALPGPEATVFCSEECRARARKA